MTKISRWNSCSSCAAGQPPGHDYPGANCISCGGKVVAVVPLEEYTSRLESRLPRSERLSEVLETYRDQLQARDQVLIESREILEGILVQELHKLKQIREELDQTSSRETFYGQLKHEHRLASERVESLKVLASVLNTPVTQSD